MTLESVTMHRGTCYVTGEPVMSRDGTLWRYNIGTYDITHSMCDNMVCYAMGYLNGYPVA